MCSMTPRPHKDGRQEKLLPFLEGFRKWNKVSNKNHPDIQVWKGNKCQDELIKHARAISPIEDMECAVTNTPACWQEVKARDRALRTKEVKTVLHSWVPVAQEGSLKGYADYQSKRKDILGT